MNATVDYCAITKKAIDDIIKQISSASAFPMVIEDSDNIWKVYTKQKNASLTIDKTDKDNIVFTIVSKSDNCNTSTKYTVKLNDCNSLTLWYFYRYLEDAKNLLAMSYLFGIEVWPLTISINTAIQEVLEPLVLELSVHRKNI